MPFIVRKQVTACQIIGIMRRPPQNGHLVAVDDGTFVEVTHAYLVTHNPREGGYLTIGARGEHGYIKPGTLGEWEVLNSPVAGDVTGANPQMCFDCPLELCAGAACPVLPPRV